MVESLKELSEQWTIDNKVKIDLPLRCERSHTNICDSKNKHVGDMPPCLNNVLIT